MVAPARGWMLAEGRMVAWLTLRGRRWSIGVLALVIVAWGAGEWAGVWGGRKRLTMQTFPGMHSEWSGVAAFVYWDAHLGRIVSDEEARAAGLQGRHVDGWHVGVHATEWAVQWLGRVIGTRGQTSIGGWESAREDQRAYLLQRTGWANQMDQLASSGALYSGKALRAASAAGPAMVTRISPSLVGLTIVERGSVLVIVVGGCWIVLALYGELRRGGAMRSYRERGLCWRCGYALGVSGLARCPECGAACVGEGYAADS